ncbi:MAG TPA: anthranilate synthase component I family protein [Solirubrobacteraceae bacterium]|nr:anthranilate synthase component I family protein [Solirubrobacteraceae bacterium]
MTGPAPRRLSLCEEQPVRIDCWTAARQLEGEAFLFLLDSAGGPRELGRHSILAWRPRWEFIAKDGRARAGPPGAARPLEGPVLDELERTLALFSAPPVTWRAEGAAPPVYGGGAVGFFAYELLHEIEAVAPGAAGDLGAADCHLLFCDLAVVTDELAGRSWILANGWGNTVAACRAECDALLREARVVCAPAGAPRRRPGGRPPHNAALASRRPPHDEAIAGRRLRWEDLGRHGVDAVTPRGRYLELVARARERIFAGDVFELCLTQRFDAVWEGAGVELYDALRAINPAPMGAYLRYPELEVLSSSPERFLRVDGERRVQTRPIKGTRPRGRYAREDRELAGALAGSSKDCAENTMIVDVARNDLGRVCEFGTITVPRLRAVERHPSVFQLVSTVCGRLRPDVTPVELLRAAFPGASMTGAPKVAAMRLIAAMEESRRGVYAGAIGYIDYRGRLDLSIAIRTIVKRGSALSFHAGGAVTSDSTPAEEHQETLDKVSALAWALTAARGAAAGVAPAELIRPASGGRVSR